MEKFLNYKRIKRVLLLDKKVYREIKQDSKHAMQQSIRVLMASALIGSIWFILYSFGVGLGIVFIAVPIGWLLISGFMHFIAKLLGGKASFTEYLRVTGYAQAPLALGIFSLPGYILGIIWAIACTIYATKEAHEISTLKASVAVVATLFVLSLLAALFMIMLGLGIIGLLTPVSYPANYFG